MSRHIIGPFTCMNKWRILRAELIGGRLHIDPNVRVSIFVDREPRRSVLYENVQHTDGDPFELWAGINNRSRDQMKPTRLGSQGDLFLEPKSHVSLQAFLMFFLNVSITKDRHLGNSSDRRTRKRARHKFSDTNPRPGEMTVSATNKKLVPDKSQLRTIKNPLPTHSGARTDIDAQLRSGCLQSG